MTYTVIDTDQPTAEPVDLAYIKLYARIDLDVLDPQLLSFIKAGRERLEALLNIVFLNHGVRMVMDSFLDDDGCQQQVIKLPRWPVVTVDSVNYKDADGNDAVVSTSVYAVDDKGKPGSVSLISGESWPDTFDQPGAVWIEFTAGYDETDVTKLPESERIWIAMVASAQYNDPESAAMAKAPVAYLKGNRTVMPL